MIVCSIYLQLKYDDQNNVMIMPIDVINTRNATDSLDKNCPNGVSRDIALNVIMTASMPIRINRTSARPQNVNT